MPSDVVIINHAHDVNEPCTSECGTPSSESVIRILDDRAVSEIEARAAKATDPPWDAQSIEMSLEADKWMRGDNNHNDSIFMAHAREDIPALCATVKHLRKENERLKSERMIVREDAERFIKQHMDSAQWQGETLMITFENEALIAALTGDVEKL